MKLKFISTTVLCSILVVLFSCKNTNIAISETASMPYKPVKGVVKSLETGEPISNANVLVKGTTIVGETDKNGNFSLYMPAGYYEIEACKEGAGQVVEKVAIDVQRSEVDNLSLEISNTSLHSNKYAYNSECGAVVNDEAVEEASATASTTTEELEDMPEVLQTFINYYINDDMNCTLLNPEDVILEESDNDGTLRVGEPVELKVLNNDLGYEVTVELRDYVSKDYGDIVGIDKDADYYFKELTPADEEQAKRWAKNRNEVFNGSFRHFLISMASEKSPFYFSYRLYSGTYVQRNTVMAYSSSTASDIEIGKEKIITPGSTYGAFNIGSPNEIRVEYIRKGNHDPNGIMGLKTYDYQTSWLTIMSDKAEFTKNGILKNPELVKITGAWRYTPVCRMLPTDYLPKI